MVIYVLNFVLIDKIYIISRNFDVYGTCHSMLWLLLHQEKNFFLKTNKAKTPCSGMNCTYKMMRKERFSEDIVLAEQNVEPEQTSKKSN